MAIPIPQRHRAESAKKSPQHRAHWDIWWFYTHICVAYNWHDVCDSLFSQPHLRLVCPACFTALLSRSADWTSLFVPCVASPAVPSATFHETLHPQNSGAVMRGSRRWNCRTNVNSWGSVIFINHASCKLCCLRTYLWTKFWFAQLQSFPHMGATVGDFYWC